MGENDLSRLRAELGMTQEKMSAFMIAIVRTSISNEQLNVLSDYLNALEQEVLSQRDARAELLTRLDRVSRRAAKIGNYRLGMKQLQRAHEALKHRFNTLKTSVDLRAEQERIQEQQAGDALDALQYGQGRVQIEPGYTDYFLQRAKEHSYESGPDRNFGANPFEDRSQKAGTVNTRL